MDGEVGLDNFRLDIGYGKGTYYRFQIMNKFRLFMSQLENNNFDTFLLLFPIGNGWVSWKSENISTEHLELIFEFDQVRNFSAVHLYTNNFFSRNVQVRMY